MQATSSFREKFTNNLYYFSLYSVSLGALYLWGYWSSFDIKVMEYIALSDVIKLAAYPLALTVLLATAGSIAGQLVAVRAGIATGQALATSKQFYRGLTIALIGAAILSIIGLLIWASPRKWFIIAPLIGSIATPFLSNIEFIKASIPNKTVRFLLIFVLASLPFDMYSRGVLEADDILLGRNFVYALNGLPEYPSRSNEKFLPRLIGKAGDYLFFYDPGTVAVVLVKIDSNNMFIFKKYVETSTSLIDRWKSR